MPVAFPRKILALTCRGAVNHLRADAIYSLLLTYRPSTLNTRRCISVPFVLLLIAGSALLLWHDML